MSFVLAAIGQLVLALLPTTEDTAAYQPYRRCVLEAAKTLESSGDDAISIGQASNARCREIRLKIVRNFAADELRNVADAIKNGGSGGDPERQWRIEAMDRELAEDVALQIVSVRAQRKNNASN